MKIKKYELQGPVYVSQELFIPIFTPPQPLGSTPTRRPAYWWTSGGEEVGASGVFFQEKIEKARSLSFYSIIERATSGVGRSAYPPQGWQP
jgi:hypothetical protein